MRSCRNDIFPGCFANQRLVVDDFWIHDATANPEIGPQTCQAEVGTMLFRDRVYQHVVNSEIGLGERMDCAQASVCAKQWPIPKWFSQICKQEECLGHGQCVLVGAMLFLSFCFQSVMMESFCGQIT